MTPKRFRKKPVEIEVMQFDGSWSSYLDIRKWKPAAGITFVPEGYEHPFRKESETDQGNGHILGNAPSFLIIHTLEGDHRADRNDQVICGVAGELYPCKPDIFTETYEEVR